WRKGLGRSCVVSVRPFLADYSVEQRDGVRVVLLPDQRWGRCDVKSINLLPNVLAKNLARDQGAFEAVFVDRDGRVTEATSSNVFVARGGALLTPPLRPQLLPAATPSPVLPAAP